MVKYCPNCNAQSQDIAKFCINCGYNFGASSDFKYITQYTIDRLETVEISDSVYNNIINSTINNAKSRYYQNLQNIPDGFRIEDIKGPMKLIIVANSFANVLANEETKGLSNYGLNIIQVNNSFNVSTQTFSLIKELSHHLYAEILEEILAYVLSVKKDDEIEAIIAFTNTFAENRFIDEYCAVMVEKSFLPTGFEDYSPVTEVFNQMSEESKEGSGLFMSVAKTLSEDIIKMINEFLDFSDKLIIEDCFKVDNMQPDPSNIMKDIPIEMPHDAMVNFLKLLIMYHMTNMLNLNDDGKTFLKDIKEAFHNVNTTQNNL